MYISQAVCEEIHHSPPPEGNSTACCAKAFATSSRTTASIGAEATSMPAAPKGPSQLASPSRVPRQTTHDGSRARAVRARAPARGRASARHARHARGACDARAGACGSRDALKRMSRCRMKLARGSSRSGRVRPELGEIAPEEAEATLKWPSSPQA